MEKTNFKSVSLAKGEVHVYDFGEIKLHSPCDIAGRIFYDMIEL